MTTRPIKGGAYKGSYVELDEFVWGPLSRNWRPKEVHDIFGAYLSWSNILEIRDVLVRFNWQESLF